MARTVAQRRPDALTAELDPDALGGAHELATRIDELQLLRFRVNEDVNLARSVSS